MSSSSAVILLNMHSLSIFINIRQKSSGVSVSVCLVQKNSPRLYYVFRFGKKHSLIDRIKSLIAIFSGSLLCCALFIWYKASGPIPDTKWSCIWLFFVAQSVWVISSPRINSAIITIHMLQPTSKILLVRLKVNENALLF